jgi:hypothetical protein
MGFAAPSRGRFAPAPVYNARQRTGFCHSAIECAPSRVAAMLLRFSIKLHTSTHQMLKQ